MPYRSMRAAALPDRERDFMDREMYRKSPYRRVVDLHSKEHGIVLPFGLSTASFDIAHQ